MTIMLPGVPWIIGSLMRESNDHTQPFSNGSSVHQLTEQLTGLQKANKEIREARRAALNLMEDAIAAKEALRVNEERMRRQKEAFQSVVNGAPLEASLNLLTRMVVDETNGKARTAFYKTNPEGTGLFSIRGAGTMPDAYADEIDGFLVGEDSLACGLAVSMGHAVITADIYDDPLWKPWVFVAEKYDYRGCWSFPIKTGDDKSVGSFALYFSEPRNATQDDIALADIVTQTAAVILSNYIEAQRRARAEEKLRQSEEKYRLQLEHEVHDRTAELSTSKDLLQATMDASMDMVQVFQAVRDEEGDIIDFSYLLINHEAEKWMPDVIGKNLLQVQPGVRKEGIFDAFKQVVETGIPNQSERHYVHEQFDGWFFQSAVKLGDGVATTTTDITERKKAAEGRYKNYLLLQQSEEMALLGSWDYDRLTGVFTWSEGMYRLFNLERNAEIKPEIYLNYATANSRAAAERVVNAIRKGDSDFEETLEIAVAGKIKMLYLKAAVIRDDEGNAARILCVDMDISALRAAEEKIRKMESKQQLEIFRVSLNTVEEERHRISESLHNGIGQTLYAIKLSLGSLVQNEERSTFDKAKDYTNSLLTDAIKETRRISHELMPATLEQFGLKNAITDICMQLSDGVHFSCHIRGLTARLEKYLELAVYRTVQELMTNVVKHAKATEATVEIAVNKNKIHIVVSDNGRGMGVGKRHKPGIGLASIRSKIKLLNGDVQIESDINSGTTVRVVVPIPKKST